METVIRLENPVVHCPYCKDAFADLLEVVACARCGARLHLECFREMDRCASCGSFEALAHREGVRRLEDVARGRKHRFVAAWVASVALVAAAVFNLTADWNLRAPS